MSESVCWICDSTDVHYTEVIGVAWCKPCMDENDAAYERWREAGFPRPPRCLDCNTTLTDMGPRCEDCITRRCLHCRATEPQCQGLQNRLTVRCCQHCFHASSGESEGGT